VVYKKESRNRLLFRLFFGLANLSKQIDFTTNTTGFGCVDLLKCPRQQTGTCNAIAFHTAVSGTGWRQWACWGRDIAKQLFGA
jgi:hypothetical protein